MPAVYDLANRGLLPPGFATRRVRATRLEGPGLRQGRARLGKEVRPHPVRRGCLEAARRGIRFVQGEFDDEEAFARLKCDHRGAGPRARHHGQPRVLPVDPAEVVPRRDRAAAQLRSRGRRRTAVAPSGDREAVRQRPATAQAAQRRRRVGVPAGQRVPDRPLPRQGDGAEHPGAAVRQPAVRADLERELRRPRADHDGRGHRRRRSRRILRRHRRRARRHPEPPAAAARPHRDGGAGLVRRGGSARREGEGALGCAAARRTRHAHRPRPVRRRAGRAARRSSASSRRRG